MGIIVIAGPPLHGKTRIAQELTLMTSGTLILDVDEVRARLFPHTFGTKRTPDEERNIMVEVYNHVCEQAALQPTNTLTIIPATFSRAVFKTPLEKLTRIRTDVRIFFLQVPVGKIGERIESRQREGSFSNIKTAADYQWALSLVDPWWHGAVVTMLDGTLVPKDIAATILSTTPRAS